MTQAYFDIFKNDTSTHAMEILHDDGIYRHLRFGKANGSIVNSFSLVTYPNHLVFSGDIGTYVFSRLYDMFEFFRSNDNTINPDYWGEKLQAYVNSGYKEYSVDKLESQLRHLTHEYIGENSTSEDIEKAIHAWVDGIVSNADNECIARQLLNEPVELDTIDKSVAKHEKALTELIQDSWEWDLQEFTGRYLWCCHAIVYGIQQYNAHLLIGKERTGK